MRLAAAVLLAASLTACTSDGEQPPSLTAPAVFYLRPPGDKAGVQDKMPYELKAEDGDEPGVRMLAADVPKGAEDTVVIRKYGGCKGSSAHVTCEVDGDYSNWADAPRAKVVAAEGAEAGDSAVVTYTYTTKDGKKLTARTRFVVGEPVVEALAPEYEKDGPRPGAELTDSVVVRNTGEVPVRGLGLELSASNGGFVEEYSNCRYPSHTRGYRAVCEFPGLTIDPGQTVALRPAIRLRTTKSDMYVSYGKDVWALDMGPGHYDTYPKGGDFGDGPELEVTKASAATRGAFVDGGGSTYVVLDSYADYEVSDVSLTGEPGDERTFEIKVRNKGPADADAAADVVFSPPFGMTVVKQPMEEYDDGVYQEYCESNGYAYTCAVGDLKPGDSRSFEFTVTLGDPGEGFLSLEDAAGTSPWDVGRRDPDPDNDEAVIRVEGEG
ncbi:DUF11 domain-containing protein [Streptomyces sp. WM6386]|uniref:DUF11 domain-containing protein n=1 Tax=Streptomyces sp. WM6386 TaxID=1415558 RepID=UPI0006969905|nr:DUF11 domain-containing protein [Streptomyces sp. WM6386]